MHAFSSVLLFVFESVKEDVFWRNYFYRVSLIKQSAQLTALAAQQQAAGKEEKNHGRQNELPLTGIFKKASLCRANVTNIPLKILRFSWSCHCAHARNIIVILGKILFLPEKIFILLLLPSPWPCQLVFLPFSFTLLFLILQVFYFFLFISPSITSHLPISLLALLMLSVLRWLSSLLSFGSVFHSACSCPQFLVCRAELSQPAWNQTPVSDTCDSSLLWQFYPGCWGKLFIISAMISKVVPNLFGTRDQFCGRQFFSRTGEGMGWFQDVSSALHFLCTLFLIWCCCCSDRRCQSMGQRLGTPDLIPVIIIKICILRIERI